MRYVNIFLFASFCMIGITKPNGLKLPFIPIHVRVESFKLVLVGEGGSRNWGLQIRGREWGDGKGGEWRWVPNLTLAEGEGGLPPEQCFLVSPSHWSFLLEGRSPSSCLIWTEHIGIRSVPPQLQIQILLDNDCLKINSFLYPGSRHFTCEIKIKLNKFTFRKKS